MKKLTFIGGQQSRASLCYLALAGLVSSFSQNAMSEDKVIVDLFNEQQVASDIVDGGNGDSQSTATGLASILGGSRDINANALSGGQDINNNGVCDVGEACSVMSISDEGNGGKLRFNNATGVIGAGIVHWDGPDQSIALDKVGLGGIDLTDGGTASGFEFTVDEADQGFIFSIEAYSNADNFTIVEIVSSAVAAGMPITRVIPFAVLENNAFCGDPGATGDPQIVSVTCGPGDQTVNFTNLGALQVQLNLPDSNGDRVTALDLQFGEIAAPKEDQPLACRVTGGGVDDFLVEGEVISLWDGTFADGEMGDFRYTFGGQVGANTVFPQIAGEWQHSEHGETGKFSFHGGTHSAKPGTRITQAICSDPGFCNPARPAPAKQIDIKGIGTFSNIGKGNNFPAFLQDAVAEPNGNGPNSTGGYTVHPFEVNIDDAGEGPGDDLSVCPVNGFGLHGGVLLLDEINACDNCTDFYRITIYKGVDVSTVIDSEGNINPDDLPMDEVIYQVFSYHNGNTQIHPPTGFDLKP